MFFSMVLTQEYILFLKVLKIGILTIFFFVSVNMGPYGSQNVKVLLLLQIATENFQKLLLNF